MGIHKTPEGRKAISNWCEQDTEAQRILLTNHRKLKSSLGMTGAEEGGEGVRH